MSEMKWTDEDLWEKLGELVSVVHRGIRWVAIGDAQELMQTMRDDLKVPAPTEAETPQMTSKEYLLSIAGMFSSGGVKKPPEMPLEALRFVVMRYMLSSSGMPLATREEYCENMIEVHKWLCAIEEEGSDHAAAGVSGSDSGGVGSGQ